MLGTDANVRKEKISFPPFGDFPINYQCQK